MRCTNVTHIIPPHLCLPSICRAHPLMKDHHVKHLEVKEVTNNEAIEKSEKNEKREKEFHKYVKILNHLLQNQNSDRNVQPVRGRIFLNKKRSTKEQNLLEILENT